MDDQSTAERLAVLHSHAVLDTPPEPQFDDIVALARKLCDAPIALVSFVECERQWFKAKLGVDMSETPIEQSVCAIAIEEPRFLVIPDLTADARTRKNALVTGRTADPVLCGCRVAGERRSSAGYLVRHRHRAASRGAYGRPAGLFTSVSEPNDGAPRVAASS